MHRNLIILIVGSLLGGTVAANASITMVWASEVGLQSYQSDGSAVLDSNFVAQIGIFQPGFIPDGTNLGAWTSNWQSFGSAPYNDADQYFSGITSLNDNSTAPIGSQIYLWLRRDDPAPPQWFVATNDSSDGDATDNWVVPDVSLTDQTTRPMYFDLNFITAPTLKIPFGKTPTDTGGGDFGGTPPVFTVQTHTVIPEPTAALSVAIACLGLLVRRRRH